MAGGPKDSQNKNLGDFLGERAAGDVPNVMILLGFEGKSCEPVKYRRLYCTPELQEYVEFLKSDAVYEQEVEIGPLALTGVLVGVVRESELRLTRVGTEEYLNGEIVADWQAGGSTGRGTTHVTTLAAGIPWNPSDRLERAAAGAPVTPATSACRC